jgi:hypothetical protein
MVSFVTEDGQQEQQYTVETQQQDDPQTTPSEILGAEAGRDFDTMSGGDGLMTEEEYAAYMVENGPFTGEQARGFFQEMTQMNLEGEGNGTEFEISEAEYNAYMDQHKDAQAGSSMVTTFQETEERMYAAGNAAESGGTYTNAEGEEVTIASDGERGMSEAEAVAYARANYTDDEGNPIFSDQDIINTYNQFNVDHSEGMGIRATANFFESLDEREARHNDWKANADTAFNSPLEGQDNSVQGGTINYALKLYEGVYTEEQIKQIYNDAFGGPDKAPINLTKNQFIQFLNHVANVYERDNPDAGSIGVDKNGMASRYVDTGRELSGEGSRPR